MFDKISAQELEMINYYRTIGAGHLSPQAGSACSNEHFLRIWKKEKKWLFDLFNGELILSKKASYERPRQNIVHDIENAYYEGETNSFCKFIEHYRAQVEYYYYGRHGHYDDPVAMPYICYKSFPILEDKDRDAYHFFRSLLNFGNLAYQTYQGDEILHLVLPKSKRKVDVVPNQTKVIRVVQSLITEFDLDKELFEKFRIKCSTFFNQSKLEGELCLSIHPLDYITMSENASNWKSCMNWRENGCYRRGTVEMMNSAYVVVAYLNNTKHPFTFGDNYSWNNKLWRQLFIVDNDFIIAIKEYPYVHERMTKDCLEWLRELINARFPGGQKPLTDHAYEYEYGENMPIEEIISNAMYNDFGCTDNGCHWAIFNEKGILPSQINYSGESECVWCGESEFAAHYDGELFPCNEEDLACKHCSIYKAVCSSCGQRLKEGEVVDWDGAYGPIHYCQDCYNRHIKTCPITGKIAHDDEEVEAGFCWILATEPTGSEYHWIYVQENCWTTHSEQWEEYFGNQKPEPQRTSWGGVRSRRYQINWDQVTNKGKNYLLSL